MTYEQHYAEINRQLWNARTEHHIHSDFYGLEGFKKGSNVLDPISLAQVGGVSGQSLLHLQCHFGLDTLSWARLGAQVTGMDLSDKAIDTARALAQELDLPARFICCNLYDLPAHLNEQFDVVFTSYGVLGWLHDLQAWGRIVAQYLKPGGVFHLIEFHPVVWMFSNDFSKVEYAYFQGEAIVEENEGTYTDRNAPIKLKEISWNHHLGQVFDALLSQGLQIEHFGEYDYSPYNCFQHTTPAFEGAWHIKGMEGLIPIVYGIKARKPLA